MPSTVGPLFVGMDAMDASLVRSLVGEGHLPVLTELLNTWDVVDTSNPAGLAVGGLWPNFWSGVGPGHHGSYCFRQVVPGGHETREGLDGDPLVSVYERLDAALGEILETAGDRPVMVLLSHGIGAHNDGNHLRFRTTISTAAFA